LSNNILGSHPDDFFGEPGQSTIDYVGLLNPVLVLNQCRHDGYGGLMDNLLVHHGLVPITTGTSLTRRCSHGNHSNTLNRHGMHHNPGT
jgi:hypothetical protein